MLEKNQCFTAEITDLTAEGNGVCHIDGMAVFVPSTAVGDIINVKIVKVLKNYAFGIGVEIITPSKDRICSDCNVSQKCGGCIFRHISYDAECKVKNDIVKNAFIRIGGLSPEFEEFMRCNEILRYRNKAQYPLAYLNGRAVCGFYAHRSHRVIPISDCALQPDIFGDITEEVLRFINMNNIAVYNEVNHTGFLRHIYIRQGAHSGEIMLCLVVRKDISKKLIPLCDIIISKFRNVKSIVLNVNPDKTNVILGKKCVTLFGNEYITDTMCGNSIEISPLSFYQINTVQAERLYAKALEYAAPDKNSVIADLYCGAGTIGLSMARKAGKIVGVEIVPQAVENARKNALTNNIRNAEFFCGDAGKVFSSLRRQGCTPDIIVVDPPRKGCSLETLEVIAEAAPEKIVMISCNPATAARDSKWLLDNGFSVKKVCGIDLFPRTGHVETVVLLGREFANAKEHVYIDYEPESNTEFPSSVTYAEIKAWIQEEYGLKVSSLYIAQVKQKHGIIERECYNKPKSEGHRVPRCPPEKEAAIEAALKHFKLI